MIKRISFDVCGTLAAHQDIFLQILPWLRQQNMSVFVIGGPRVVDSSSILTSKGYQRGVHYDAIYSVMDFLSDNFYPLIFVPEKGGFFAKYEDDWWSAKSKMCAKYKIATHVDNEFRYSKFFDNIATRFFQLDGSSMKEFYKIARKIYSA